MSRGRRWCLAITAGMLALAVVLSAVLWNNRLTPPEPGTYAGELWSGNSLRIPFRWCPPGTFQMGSPAIEVDRETDEVLVGVTLTEGVWLGETEVTQGQWQRVMGTTPWRGEKEVNEGWNYPAAFVRHSGKEDSAEAFCERLTIQERVAGHLPADWEYRLPTEAEWEYACRAGTTTAFSFGDDAKEIGRHAWFEGNSEDGRSGPIFWLQHRAVYAHPVGTRLANAWGLRDMHGSVREWCADGYEAQRSGGIDPRVEIQGSDRVFRGGSWIDPARRCRSAYRDAVSPSFRYFGLGFRVALSRAGKATP